MSKKLSFLMVGVVIHLLLLQWQIAVAGVRVIGLRQLTTESVYQNNPSWSPSGEQIVYTQDPINRPGMGDIWVMNADGTGKYALVTHPAWDERPSWSPDGTRVAFISNRSVWPGDVWVKNLGTGAEIRLTYVGNINYVTSSQAWSPDASKIVFLTNRNSGSWDTYVMNSDGSHQTLLATSNTWAAAWAPTGNKIAFVRDGDLWVMNMDGSDQKMIVANGDGDLSWSPDGSMIAFPRDGDIWVTTVDGNRITKLTTHPARDGAPAWSPNGDEIAFFSERSGNRDIWVLDIRMSELICKAFLTPDRLNVMRDPEHAFKIHVYPCDSMDVSVGDSAEVYVDIDTSGSFDEGEKYEGKVSSTNLDGSATDIAIKVYCPDIVDNDPAVAIYSINSIPVVDTSDNQIDYLHLETFSPRKHQTTETNIIDQVVLMQNYPNPFNPETEIRYTLAYESDVKLAVYNVKGQKVKVLVDEYQSAGYKSVKWDGKDEKGSPVASGVYFYKLSFGTEVMSKKMLLLK